ncbi:hypothetical protein KAI87_15110, partial [Myxococcota bacterium]|nr:hypothetical protein [Myxococcota bacterium]
QDGTNVVLYDGDTKILHISQNGGETFTSQIALPIGFYSLEQVVVSNGDVVKLGISTNMYGDPGTMPAYSMWNGLKWTTTNLGTSSERSLFVIETDAETFLGILESDGAAGTLNATSFDSSTNSCSPYATVHSRVTPLPGSTGEFFLYWGVGDYERVTLTTDGSSCTFTVDPKLTGGWETNPGANLGDGAWIKDIVVGGDEVFFISEGDMSIFHGTLPTLDTVGRTYNSADILSSLSYAEGVDVLAFLSGEDVAGMSPVMHKIASALTAEDLDTAQSMNYEFASSAMAGMELDRKIQFVHDSDGDAFWVFVDQSDDGAAAASVGGLERIYRHEPTSTEKGALVGYPRALGYASALAADGTRYFAASQGVLELDSSGVLSAKWRAEFGAVSIQPTIGLDSDSLFVAVENSDGYRNIWCDMGGDFSQITVEISAGTPVTEFSGVDFAPIGTGAGAGVLAFIYPDTIGQLYTSPAACTLDSPKDLMADWDSMTRLVSDGDSVLMASGMGGPCRSKDGGVTWWSDPLDRYTTAAEGVPGPMDCNALGRTNIQEEMTIIPDGPYQAFVHIEWDQSLNDGMGANVSTLYILSFADAATELLASGVLLVDEGGMMEDILSLNYGGVDISGNAILYYSEGDMIGGMQVLKKVVYDKVNEELSPIEVVANYSAERSDLAWSAGCHYFKNIFTTVPGYDNATLGVLGGPGLCVYYPPAP